MNETMARWGRRVRGGTGPRHRSGARRAATGVAVLLVLVAGCTRDHSGSLSDEYPTLSIGHVGRPEPVTFEPYFDTVDIAGQRYTLPFPAQQLLDAGWVVHQEPFVGYSSAVMPFYSTYATLVRADDPNGYAENRSIRITIVNTTPYEGSAENYDVWGVHFGEGLEAEPYPGVHAGASKADVATAMNIPYDGAAVAGESRFDLFRETLSMEQRRDLSAGSSSSLGDRPIRLARVIVTFKDDIATGGYDVRYAPRTAMTDGYVTMPAWSRPYPSDPRCSSLPYRWLLPGDLSSEPTIVDGRQIVGLDWIWSFVPDGGLTDDSSSYVSASYLDGGATYSIDGHDYAMAASNIPTCKKITETGAAQAEDQVFAGLDDATTVDVAPEKALLWEGDRSSAGVLVYRGPGPSTDQDTMQVVVSYCDWEHGTRLTFLYSLLALEPGTTISEGAANLLLTVASDATRSITRTPA